jgi:bifunctional non-homologous end joining protein LigD
MASERSSPGHDGFRALSRRGWEMTKLLPELGDLPAGYVFDGEIVAFQDGVPHFPLVCARLLHGERNVPLTYVIFDLVMVDGETIAARPYRERRAVLETLKLGRGPWYVPDTFDDGEALFAVVCQHGLEGVVAKRRGQTYRSGERGWVKIKNRDYWRYGEELESLRRAIDSPCSREDFALSL